MAYPTYPTNSCPPTAPAPVGSSRPLATTTHTKKAYPGGYH